MREMKQRVYVAFDFDDVDIKNELVRQSKLPDCPFDLDDWSITRAVQGNWVEDAKVRIKASQRVIVVCGEQTHQSGGAAIEVQIAQELKKPISCLAGTRVSTPTPPAHIPKGTPIYTWRWATLETLLDGKSPPENAIVRRAP